MPVNRHPGSFSSNFKLTGFPYKEQRVFAFPFEEGTLCLDPLIAYNMYLTHRAAAGAGRSAPDADFHANM